VARGNSDLLIGGVGGNRLPSVGFLIKTLVIVAIIAGILGGSAYFAYEMFWKPEQLEKQERAEIEAKAALPPPPHPGIAAHAAAVALLDAGRREEARTALEKCLLDFPDSPKSPDVRAALGNLNAAELFSPVPGPGKEPYAVVKGDALAKIATKTGAGAELIFLSNNLPSINLSIGQVLQIPKLEIAAEIDRAAKTLTLTNAGQFFKSYPVVSARVGGLAAGKSLETKVSDKFAMFDSKRVAFGSKEYPAAERTVMLAPGGVMLRAAPSDGSAPPPGIVLSPEDLAEIYVLVTRGTPVTIH